MNSLLKELILAAILGIAASLVFGVEVFASRVLSSAQTQESCTSVSMVHSGTQVHKPLTICETPVWRVRQNDILVQLIWIVDDGDAESGLK